MRMKDDQLRQILLDHSRTIIDDKSPELFTIRDLAEAADISIGTIYNYFNSKDYILFEVTALYWDEALIDLNQLIEDGPFYLQVEQIFHYLKTQISESGARLMHSLSNVRKTGTRRMQRTHQEIQQLLIGLMNRDNDIDASLWNDSFKQETYTWFIVVNIMTSLLSGAEDIDFFILIMKKTLYER